MTNHKKELQRKEEKKNVIRPNSIAHALAKDVASHQFIYLCCNKDSLPSFVSKAWMSDINFVSS
jgi:hypothetical protein